MKRRRREESFQAAIKGMVDEFVATIETKIAEQVHAVVATLVAQGKQDRGAVPFARRARARAANVVSGEAPRKRAAKKLAPGPSISPIPVVRKVQTREIDQAAAERTAELNRLRSILRPAPAAASIDPIAAQPMPEAFSAATVSGADPSNAAAAAPNGPTAYQDPIRALEEQIRNGVPFLSTLPPNRLAAQVAAWAGRARLLQADGRTRIGAGMLIEKLRGLQRAMEVGYVEALDTAAVADWRRYVAIKETEATGTGASTANGDERAARDDYDGVWAG